MIIPLKLHSGDERVPLANWGLVGVTILVFLGHAYLVPALRSETRCAASSGVRVSSRPTQSSP